MRLSLYDGLIKNLKQEIPTRMRREYLTSEKAHERLKELTGQDFDIDDIDGWENWIHENVDDDKILGSD